MTQMVKAKPKAKLSVSDGAGGMGEGQDRGCEKSDWPIRFDVSLERDQAERWMRYLRAEMDRRNWGASTLQQLERGENSGSSTIMSAGKTCLEVTWENK